MFEQIEQVRVDYREIAPPLGYALYKPFDADIGDFFPCQCGLLDTGRVQRTHVGGSAKHLHSPGQQVREIFRLASAAPIDHQGLCIQIRRTEIHHLPA